MKTKVYDIVIPYIADKAAWHELKFTLRSISENFDGQVRIWLIGDKPVWANNLVEHIPLDLIKGIDFCHALDVNNKLKFISELPDIGEHFIYTYDDTLFLNPTSYDKIKKLKSEPHIPDQQYIWRKSSGSHKWTRLLANAFNTLKGNGLPTYNYETHLPRVFSKSKLQKLFKMYPVDSPFLVSTLYYNTFHKARPIILERDDPYRLMINRELDLNDLNKAIDGQMFLNYNNLGLTRDLRSFISIRFCEASPFERVNNE